MLIDKCKQQEAVIGELERQQAELGLVRDQQSSELSVLEHTRLDLQRRTYASCSPVDATPSTRTATSSSTSTCFARLVHFS